MQMNERALAAIAVPTSTMSDHKYIHSSLAAVRLRTSRGVVKKKLDDGRTSVRSNNSLGKDFKISLCSSSLLNQERVMGKEVVVVAVNSTTRVELNLPLTRRSNVD
jgi:hypothetical protein